MHLPNELIRYILKIKHFTFLKNFREKLEHALEHEYMHEYEVLLPQDTLMYTYTRQTRYWIFTYIQFTDDEGDIVEVIDHRTRIL